MFNVHNAFLNGKLDGDKGVFIEQPPGYEESDLKKYCITLYESIYELKQARDKWYEIVCQMLVDLGFEKCKANQHP